MRPIHSEFSKSKWIYIVKKGLNFLLAKLSYLKWRTNCGNLGKFFTEKRLEQFGTLEAILQNGQEVSMDNK